MEFEFDGFTCIQFFFAEDNNDELIFFTATEIFRFDFMKDEDQETSLYTLNNFLLDPPNFGVFNKDQSICIVTSINDILYINLKTGYELDLDDQESIGDILNILGDDKYFYVLANKRHDILGYYLLMIEIENPEKPATYLINWTNKFNIRNVDLNFMFERKAPDDNP